MLLSVLSVVDNLNGYNCFPLRCSSTGADFFYLPKGIASSILRSSRTSPSARYIIYYVRVCMCCDTLLHSDKIKKKFFTAFPVAIIEQMFYNRNTTDKTAKENAMDLREEIELLIQELTVDELRLVLDFASRELDL